MSDDTYSVIGQEVARSIALSDPGIDDFRNELLWSPDSPTLVDARLGCSIATTLRRRGRVSYTALRAVSVQATVSFSTAGPITLRHGARPGLLAGERA